MPAPPPVLVSSTRGDTYVIQHKPLGIGASAVVFRATTGRMGGVVAVKLLKDKEGKSWRAPSAEELEIWRAGIVQFKSFHSVARFLDVACDPHSRDPLGLVLELCSGESLRDLLEGGLTARLSLPVKKRLGLSLIRATGQFTRQRRWNFSDLAPQNSVVLSTWEVVLFDLDSCWLFDQRVTSGAVVSFPGAMGTEGFRAPELMRDPGLLPTPETTLWALAVMLFFILHGKHPATPATTPDTQGVTEEDLVRDGIYPLFRRPDPLLPVPAYDPNAAEVPAAIKNLLRDALTGPARHRPTAEEFEEAFLKWQPKAPPKRHRRRFSLPRRALKWATLTAAAIALGCAGYWGWEYHGQFAEPPKPTQPRPTSTPFLPPSLEGFLNAKDPTEEG